MTDEAMSPLRRRMIEDMTTRKLAPKTQQGDIRTIRDFAAFLGRSPDTASFETSDASRELSRPPKTRRASVSIDGGHRPYQGMYRTPGHGSDGAGCNRPVPAPI